MKEKRKSTPVALIAFVLTLFVVFVVAAFILLGKADTNAGLRARNLSYNDGWTLVQNGQSIGSVNLTTKITTEPSGITSLKKDLPSSISSGDAIAVRNYHQLLHIKVGGNIIYAYPNLGWTGVGNIISDEWIVVNLKPEYAGQTLELSFTNTSIFKVSFNISDIYYGADNDVIQQIRKLTLLPFIWGLIVLIFGLLLLIMSWVYGRPTDQRPNTAMGAALLCFGVWLVNRAMLPVLSRFSGALYLFAVIALLFVAPCIFLYAYYRNKEHRKLTFRCYQFAIAADVFIILSCIVVRYNPNVIAILCYVLSGFGILLNGILLFRSAFGPKANLLTRTERALNITEFFANIILPVIVIAESIIFRERMWTELSMFFRTGLLIYAFIYMMFVSWRNLLAFSDRVNVTNRLKENQMKLMLDQIQPHFLFNTLSAIRILIKMEPDAAYDAMYDFSKYLRANIDNVNNIDGIDFASEVDHIKSYVNIEKLRFGDRVNAEYDIQCDDFFVPPLAIQGLVENAIQHGILAKMRGGTIWLRSYETDDYDIVEVEDDGIGFNRETAAGVFSAYANDDDKAGMESNKLIHAAMSEVMENLNLTDASGSPIVLTGSAKNTDLAEENLATGLMNIFLRLREMCGAKFEIASTEGEGTLIRVLIPKN
ncbi:MAG: histidine kinase [Firmicutes bacterium]|nr:histidine kinase [Bacillota bacterium]